MAFNPRDYDDYPMGDEKTYQNRKKFGSSVHPNAKVLRKGKVQTAGEAKRKALQARIKKVKGYGEK